VNEALDDKIIIFATPLARETMKTCKKFYEDGTFKSCPRPFYQLYSLHGFIGNDDDTNNLIPIIYALLPDKSEKTYTRLFTSLRDQLQQVHLTTSVNTN
jgi:hypothetical protein